MCWERLAPAGAAAGDSVLSRIVNAAINTPAIFSVMKLGAREVMKSTSRKKGVPWDENVKALQQSEVRRGQQGQGLPYGVAGGGLCDVCYICLRTAFLYEFLGDLAVRSHL